MKVSVKKRSLYLILTSVCILIAAGIWIYNFSKSGYNQQESGKKDNKNSVVPLEFVQERINIDIEPGWATVTGMYGFRCKGLIGRQFHIMYPFPVDEQHAFPEKILVSQADSTIIPFTEDRNTNSIRFAVNLLTHPEFTVTYRQRISGYNVKYILTTTSAWQKPLEHAEFIIAFPESLLMESISYKPDKKRKVKEKQIYTIKRKNFMPDRDLTISWK